MTKEEFKSKKEIINSKIRELNNEGIVVIFVYDDGKGRSRNP